MMDDDLVTVTLKVKRSPISGRGIGRVNLKVLDKMNLSESKNIEVVYRNKVIIVKVVADNLISKDLISLRIKDMEKLSVENDDEVTLRPHISKGLFKGKKFFFK